MTRPSSPRATRTASWAARTAATKARPTVIQLPPTAAACANPYAESSVYHPHHQSHPSQPGQVGDFYWGYASGVIATKVPGWGEFVLAELTQTFDKSDPSYFFPLMQQVEQRLGRRPRLGAFDAAYDAF